MSYKILAFDSVTGRIDVEFDEVLTYGLMLPIDSEGKVPSGADLDAFITKMTPTAEIERVKNIAAVATKTIANADEITALIQLSSNIVDPILDVPLKSAIVFCVGRINATVSSLRQKYITYIAGQDFTYMAKYLQAKAYKEADYTGDVPPYIAAEAEVTGNGPVNVTNAILDMYQQWTTVVDPQIEAARLAGKKEVTAATTNAEVDAGFRNCIGKLQKIVDAFPIFDPAGTPLTGTIAQSLKL